MSDTPWLTILGVVPLIGAAGVALIPRSNPRLIKQLSLAVSLVVLGLTIAMAADFDVDAAGFQFTEAHDWIPSFGVQYAVGVDGIALALIALVAVLVPVVLLASWDDFPGDELADSPDSLSINADAPVANRNPRTFFGLLLVLETMMIGVFAATDVFLFYVFFEAMLIPMYFIIGSFGGPRRSYAAVKFLLYSLFGGLLMLASVIGLFVVSSDELGEGTFEFAALQEMAATVDPNVQKALFLGFFIAFAIKAPLWPFHTWLPDAGAEAPIGGAILLVGVLDKVGTFGFIRYCLPLFPDATDAFAPWIVALCVIGILYGALLAMGQKDLKRLVAYTSISHFGFIAMGIFALTTTSGTGAVLYMVNHGLATGALFLAVGFLIARRRSRLIADYGGLGKAAPILGGVFLIAALATLSLPGLATFISEFLVLVGTYPRYPLYAVIATIGIIFAAIYVLLMYQRTMQGPITPANEGARDLSGREALVVAPVIALLLVLGFYPKPLLEVIDPAVQATMQDAGQEDPEPELANLTTEGGSE